MRYKLSEKRMKWFILTFGLLWSISGLSQVNLSGQANFAGQAYFKSPGAVVYILKEYFEGPGFQNSWTFAGGGTGNDQYNTSPAPLAGSYSLYFNVSSNNKRCTNILASTYSEVWGFFLFNTLTTSGQRYIITLQDSSGNDVFYVRQNSGGAMNCAAGTGGGASTSDAMSTSTLYYVWFHYKKGSGANAQASVGWNTSATETTSGNKFASLSNGNATADVGRILLGVPSSGTASYQHIQDNVFLASNSSVGNNPQ